jgi:hypothetical protein
MKYRWKMLVALLVIGLVSVWVYSIASASGSTKNVHRTITVTSVGANQLWPGRKMVVPTVYKGRKVLRYQWYRCNLEGKHCSKIRGATHYFYVVRRADIGHRLRAQVVTLSAIAETAPSTAVGHGRPKNTSIPTITDDGAGGGSLAGPVVGDNLGGSAGTWSEVVHYTYQWFDCVPSGTTPPVGFTATATLDGLQCAGGVANTSPSAQTTSTTAPTYPLSDADLGFDIVLEVTGYNT